MTTDVNYSLLSVNSSPFYTIPLDVLPLIFNDGLLPSKLVKVESVCKEWQKFGASLREAIRPPKAMGVKELKTINPNIVDAGIEFPLPVSAYRLYAEKKGWLFFNPGKVKMKNANGEIKDVVLNTQEAIGNLCNTGFAESSWKPALKDKREEEPPHWVWIDTEALGFNQTYAQQRDTAKEEDKKAYPERYQATPANSDMEVDSENKPTTSEPKQIVQIADINDLALGMLMAKALFNECPFIWDPANGKYTLIRTKNITKDEQNREWRICVGFAPSGLHVRRDSDYAISGVGFVCARKSFGI